MEPVSIYNAVPFLGINKVFVSTFSILRSFIFLSIPPAYPVRLPLDPITLWHGTIKETGLCATAPPTACADIWPSPFCSAIF